MNQYFFDFDSISFDTKYKPSSNILWLMTWYLSRKQILLKVLMIKFCFHNIWFYEIHIWYKFSGMNSKNLTNRSTWEECNDYVVVGSYHKVHI